MAEGVHLNPRQLLLAKLYLSFILLEYSTERCETVTSKPDDYCVNYKLMHPSLDCYMHC